MSISKAYKKKITRILQGLAFPLLTLAIWEGLTVSGTIREVFLPIPHKLPSVFWEMLLHERLLSDFWISIQTVFYGFTIGSLLAIITGIAAGQSKCVERFIVPSLNAFRQIPSFAWFPLIMLWFGIGGFAKATIIAIAVFFPVFMNTFQGIRQVPAEYLEVAKIFEFSRIAKLRKVVLPSATPSILVGIRYGAGLSWMMIVAAEMMGSAQGIGFLLSRAQELLMTSNLFVLIVSIGVVGSIIDFSLRFTERRLLVWKKESVH